MTVKGLLLDRLTHMVLLWQSAFATIVCLGTALAFVLRVALVLLVWYR